MLQYDWSTAGVLNPIEACKFSSNIYCSEHEAIVLDFHCRQYVHGLCINEYLDVYKYKTRIYMLCKYVNNCFL